jgi:DNA mismatch repair protein MutL
MIFKKIFGAVHTALKNEVFDSFAIDEEKDMVKESIAPSFEEITFKIKEEEEKVKLANTLAKTMMEQGVNLKANNLLDEDKIENTYVSNYSNNSSTLSDNDKVDSSEDNSSYTPHSNTETIKNNNESSNVKAVVNIPIDLKSNITSEEVNNDVIKEDFTLNEENTTKEIDTAITYEIKDTNKEVNEKISKPKPIAKFPPITIIGQYNRTYILGEYEGTLFMIDQHAAHEKILFEKYLREIEEGSIIIQPLMVPSIIDLSIDDYSYFEDNKEIFKTAGFLLEEFGGNSLSLKEVPYFLGKLNPKKLFLDILDNIKNLGNGKTSEVKHNAIASKACKAAIKGNDKLELNEMIKLVEDLRYIDDPFHCPHGRPVIIKFTSTDIDKKFRRII